MSNVTLSYVTLSSDYNFLNSQQLNLTYILLVLIRLKLTPNLKMTWGEDWASENGPINFVHGEPSILNGPKGNLYFKL